MASGRLGSVFTLGRTRRSAVVDASRVPGSELVRLGGGEVVPTPSVPSLPLREVDRERGLCGDTLALPPAEARILNGVQILVGENVLRTRAGDLVVSRQGPTAPARRLPRRATREPVSLRQGSASLHGMAGSAPFERLVEALPSSLLLQHPALREHAPITLVHDGRAGLLEGFLLDAVANRQVRLESVSPGSTVEPERLVLPSPVARAGGGALPRWYRRWVDETASLAGHSPSTRRILLTHGPGDPLLSQRAVLGEATRAGFVLLDTLTGALGEDSTLDGPALAATLRDARAVLGASDEALAHSLVCRKAAVVQIVDGSAISPRVAQLAASRALPHHLARESDLAELLETLPR